MMVQSQCTSSIDCGNGAVCSGGYYVGGYNSDGSGTLNPLAWIVPLFILLGIIDGCFHHHDKGRGAHHGDFVSVGHGYGSSCHPGVVKAVSTIEVTTVDITEEKNAALYFT